MASYKYFKVTRSVHIGGGTLTDWRIVGGSAEHEAIEEFERESPLIVTEYTLEEPSYSEIKRYWKDQSGG